MSESIQDHAVNNLIAALCTTDDWITAHGAAIEVVREFEDRLAQEERERMTEALIEVLTLVGKARKAA